MHILDAELKAEPGNVDSAERPWDPLVLSKEGDEPQRELRPGDRITLRPGTRVLLSCKSGAFRVQWTNQDTRRPAEIVEPLCLLTLSASSEVLVECITGGTFEAIAISGTGAR